MVRRMTQICSRNLRLRLDGQRLSTRPPKQKTSAPSFPVTPDQLLMLEEDNTGDARRFYETFGLTPVPLARGLGDMFH